MVWERWDFCCSRRPQPSSQRAVWPWTGRADAHDAVCGLLDGLRAPGRRRRVQSARGWHGVHVSMSRPETGQRLLVGVLPCNHEDAPCNAATLQFPRILSLGRTPIQLVGSSWARRSERRPLAPRVSPWKRRRFLLRCRGPERPSPDLCVAHLVHRMDDACPGTTRDQQRPGGTPCRQTSSWSEQSGKTRAARKNRNGRCWRVAGEAVSQARALDLYPTNPRQPVSCLVAAPGGQDGSSLCLPFCDCIPVVGLATACDTAPREEEEWVWCGPRATAQCGEWPGEEAWRASGVGSSARRCAVRRRRTVAEEQRWKRRNGEWRCLFFVS